MHSARIVWSRPLGQYNVELESKPGMYSKVYFLLLCPSEQGKKKKKEKLESLIRPIPCHDRTWRFSEEKKKKKEHKV